MNILFRSLKRCKVVTLGVRFVYNLQPEHLLKSVRDSPPAARTVRKQHYNTITTANTMAQRSITSFFNKTPKKSIDMDNSLDSEASPSGKDTPPSSKASIRAETASTHSKTPIKKSVKRQRLDSSGSGSASSSPQKSPEPSLVQEIKKKSKRQRIESSSSEASQSPKKIPKEEKVTPKVDKKKSRKTYASPKCKKVNVKEEKVPLVERNGKVDTSTDNPKQKKGKDEVKNEVVQVKIELEVAKENKVKEDVVETGTVEETEYNPAKAKYHPIRDACWSPGQPVPYLALAKTLEAIEGTSARLKMIEILSNYFRSVMVLTPEDLLPSVYMCLNQLAPAYHSLELGIAETYLMKAIGQCTGRTLAQVKAAAAKCGDLGLVAEQARATQRTMFQSAPLEARKVFQALKDIAHMTGQASVNKKIAKIQSLYVACRNAEARYLIRSLAGKLRIGLAEQSVLQALALAATMTPPPQRDVLDASRGLSPEEFKEKVEATALLIKTTYCECPNYELVLSVLLRHGAAALPAHCRLTPGIPLKPMLAHPTKGVHEVFNRFEGLEFTCEWKYDGERAQIHVPALPAPGSPPGPAPGPDLARAAVFSRSQEDNTSKYPDVLRRLPALLTPAVTSCVLDCEAVAYDTINKQILPFQVLSTRKRKDAVEADIRVQVCVFVFDLLFLNGAPLVARPLRERRALLREHFAEVPGEWQFATSADCSTMEQVQAFLEESVRGSCEGLMVKTLSGKDATYEIARRSRNWLKLKKDYLEGVGDTVDAVVLGGYSGRGKRAGVWGGFLLACYDPHTEEYQSLCKIGTGFSDDDLQTLSETLKEHVIDGPRNYYRYESSHSPDVWFAPAAVWEVRCADLSLSPSHRAALGLVEPDKGVSLRFPRFVRVRDDKTPEDATSAQQVAELYMSQDQVKNQTNKTTVQDDFY